jgi:hypothetical protein
VAIHREVAGLVPGEKKKIEKVYFEACKQVEQAEK